MRDDDQWDDEWDDGVDENRAEAMTVAATTFLVDVIIAFVWVENLTFSVLIVNC